MIEIKVRDVGPYKEISKDGIAFYGLLNEKESIQAACELISAAEDLLPIDRDVEEHALIAVREELEK